MADMLRTIIIPAAIVTKARTVGSELSAAGEGMYVTGLRPIGSTGLPTHYVSSGFLRDEFNTAITNAIALYNAAAQGAASQGKPFTTTQTDANDLIANGLVHAGFDSSGNVEDPHQLFKRLGLEIYNPGGI